MKPATTPPAARAADNLADATALGEASALAHQIMTGSWGGAARTLVSVIGRHIAGGLTPEVRQEVGRLLLRQGGAVTAGHLQQVLNDAIQQANRARTRELLLAAIVARSIQPQLSTSER